MDSLIEVEHAAKMAPGSAIQNLKGITLDGATFQF